jgi:predicted nuclease with TOPRIM domain
VKRRIQNRAAQRRFRERRDEQNKNLQEKVTELQEKYEALEEKLRQKSEEASQFQSDNAGLKSEVESLRQRWRTMVLLLQRPNSLQFLSVLVGGEKSLSSPDGQDLDGYLRCLDALILPDRAQP